MLEDDSALRVGDLREAIFPFDFVIRRHARLGEEAADGQAGGLLLGSGWDDGWGGSGGGLGLDFGHVVSLPAVSVSFAPSGLDQRLKAHSKHFRCGTSEDVP